MDIVSEALIAGAKMKATENRRLRLKFSLLIEDIEKHYNTSVNLPRYRCRCDSRLKYFCPICLGKGWLTYNEALKSYNIDSLPMDLQIPQCHICTKFDTDDNPLFAYSYFERNGEFKFIYRCQNGHSHDHGMILIDLHTNLEVYL